MNRRSVCLALAMIFALVASAPAADLVEGRDFIAVKPAQPTDGRKIVVTEFFSYQCPHCYAFSKAFAAWFEKLPADVDGRRQAVTVGHDPWESSARAFYALESLGKLKAVDAAMFDAIHKEGLPLVSEIGIGTWLDGRGIPFEQFSAAFRSSDVDAKFKRGEQMAAAHAIPSVPTIAIDGKYLVAIDGAIDYAVQLSTVDKLIDRVRKERASKR